MCFKVIYRFPFCYPVRYPVVLILLILRDDHGDILTNSLFFCIPIQLLCSRVYAYNCPIGFLSDNRIGRGLNNQRQEFLHMFRFMLIREILIDDTLFLVRERNRAEDDFTVNTIFTPYRKNLRSFSAGFVGFKI